MPTPPRLAGIDPARYELPAAVTARLCSPSLVVFMDRVRSNVRQVLRYMDGDPDRWRPHLKTTKMPEVWRELVLAGVRHFKCATPREAAALLGLLNEMAVEDADLLVAYPLVAPNLDRVADLAAAYPATRVSVLSEHPDHAAAVPPHLGVFADVNPEMDRTGIPLHDVAAICAVARAALERRPVERGAGERGAGERRAGERTAGERGAGVSAASFAGLHFYDGHVRDAERAVRESRAWRLYDRLLELRAAVVGAGLPCEELVTSGTPAFRYALSHRGLRGVAGSTHRVSPGTVVFHDSFSDELLADVELEPAAVLFTRVVSHPADGLVTCDAGSKSLAAEAGDPAAFVLGHPELVAQTPSEEHLPLRVTRGPAPPRGTALMLVPRHVCPTVNLAESALVVDPGREPRVVAVAARAHDVFLDRSGK